MLRHFGKPDSLHLRMAFVDFSGEDILEDSENMPEDITQFEPFLRKHTPKVLTAFDRIEALLK